MAEDANLPIRLRRAYAHPVLESREFDNDHG
jgi:hypothetical protein